MHDSLFRALQSTRFLETQMPEIQTLSTGFDWMRNGRGKIAARMTSEMWVKHRNKGNNDDRDLFLHVDLRFTLFAASLLLDRAHLIALYTTNPSV